MTEETGFQISPDKWDDHEIVFDKWL